ncbi:MAG: cell division regulator GpsB [Acetilactobacillus jinshanensis]
MGKIHFTPKDILQKDFKQKIRGYDPTDVDSFLDMVIRDYETFNKSIQQLQDENDQLRQKVDHLTRSGASDNSDMTSPQMTQTRVKIKIVSPQPDNATYINILKRLANLENHVFGHSTNQTHTPNQF